MIVEETPLARAFRRPDIILLYSIMMKPDYPEIFLKVNNKAITRYNETVPEEDKMELLTYENVFGEIGGQ